MRKQKAEKQKVESRKVESRNVENENENEDEYNYEDEDEDEAMDQNKKIEGLNHNLNEIIDKTKLFEEQVKSLKKREDLKGYWPSNDYDDKELKSKYFKIELPDMSNEIDKKLFEQIFCDTLIKLADKLINTTDREENQIIVKNIEKNKDKLFKQDEFCDWVIQPSDRCINLIDSINLILNFNETIQLDLV